MVVIDVKISAEEHFDGFSAPLSEMSFFTSLFVETCVKDLYISAFSGSAVMFRVCRIWRHFDASIGSNEKISRPQSSKAS